MKNKFKLLGLAATLLAISTLALPAQTVVGNWNAIGRESATNGVGSPTNTWAVAPAGTGSARVQYINAGTDKATALFKFYTNSAPFLVSSNLAAGGSNWSAGVTNTGTIWPVTNGDLLLVRHVVSNASYELLTATATSPVGFTFTGAFGLNTGLSNALSIGDIIYKLGQWDKNAGAIQWATTSPINTNTVILTNTVQFSHGVFTGQPGQPLIMQLDSTAGGFIRNVGGDYIKY
jgi:hypothetical protein